jgi:DNA-binding response OmpR family regulator
MIDRKAAPKFAINARGTLLPAYSYPLSSEMKNPNEREWVALSQTTPESCASDKEGGVPVPQQGKSQFTRILFVDDEPGLCATMSAILKMHGYDVIAVQTVNDALAQITSAQFDVLISDLNIGSPGDGFTVVSAMRRTQPTCITLILTGYPGFDSALEAIRSQVDDYLIKPAAIPTLIELIEKTLESPRPGTHAPTKRISQILRECVFEITQRTLKEMKSDPGLGALSLTDEQRIEFIPRTIEDLAAILDSPEPEQAMKDAIESAQVKVAKRNRQGYTAPLLVRHVRLLEQAIYDVIHEHLLSLNLSYFMFDLKRLSAALIIQLEHALLSFLESEPRLSRQAEQDR